MISLRLIIFCPCFGATESASHGRLSGPETSKAKNVEDGNGCQPLLVENRCIRALLIQALRKQTCAVIL